MAPQSWVYAATTLIVLGATLFQILIRAPALERSGVYRNLSPMNNNECGSIEALKACEKISVHPSGLIYLACAGSIESRITWMPTLDALNATALRSRQFHDHLVTYDVPTGRITKLALEGFTEPRGLNLHGMGVVVDEKDPNMLWIYLVNHRPPVDTSVHAEKIGANSVVEVFKTRLGADHVEWVQTVEDAKVMVTPNDIVGGANGQEVWFTNDNSVKTGIMRHIDAMFSLKSTFVGYCHLKKGCKIASSRLHASNGIVRASDGLILVGSYLAEHITVHKQQEDNTLVLLETIGTGLPVDNLALSSDGSIIAAAFPKSHMLVAAARNINITVPSVVLRVSKRATLGSVSGKSLYKVEKIYEDKGELGSFATTAAMHGDILYVHGLMAHRMLACKIHLSS
ncbi:hypothetical protein BDV93DRAFT_541341, partial [Ceratobasidium sp. AG-I]